MTNEPGQSAGGQPEPQDVQSPVEEVQSQMSGALAKLSGAGEPLIAGGAALAVLVDFFGKFIFQEYSFSYVAWLPAVLILVAIGMHRFGGAALPMAYGGLLSLLAFAAGVVIVRELIDDLRYEVLDQGGATVVFALLFYVAGALLLIGAWQLWSTLADES